MQASHELTAHVFPSELGWMAMAGHDEVVCHLTFGHSTPGEAMRRLTLSAGALPEGSWHPELADRLQALAAGEMVDFADVEVHAPRQTPFQEAVVAYCRKIPYGQKLTYGQLAELAGSPRASRAVGNVMARNPVPLIVPCHRVVGSAGGLGGYSAGAGVRLKLRLLEMEACRSLVTCH